MTEQETECRYARRNAVVEAAKRMIYLGTHCTEGWRGPCEHCEAWDVLEAAVKNLPPIDQFVREETSA